MFFIRISHLFPQIILFFLRLISAGSLCLLNRWSMILLAHLHVKNVKVKTKSEVVVLVTRFLTMSAFAKANKVYQKNHKERGQVGGEFIVQERQNSSPKTPFWFDEVDILSSFSCRLNQISSLQESRLKYYVDKLWFL